MSPARAEEVDMPDPRADEVRDMVVEAVNAKDPDMFGAVNTVSVPESLVDRVLTVMERWPRLMLSRGEMGPDPVAIVWLPDEDDRYAQVAYLEFDVESGSARMEVVDDVPPELIAEPPTGMELAEWENADAVGEGWVH